LRVAALENLDATNAPDRKARNRAAAAVEKAIKKEESPRVRIAALGFLYRLGTARALDRVLVGIVDPAPPVREWVRALVRDRPDTRLHEAVIRAMKEDSSWRFRASMVDLLLEGRWSTTRRALVDALDDKHVAVSARAAEALERLTGRSFGTDRRKWIAHFEDEAAKRAREKGRTVAPRPEKIDVSDKPLRGLTPLLYTIPVREKSLVFVVDMSSSMHKTSRSSHFTELIEAIFGLPSDAKFNILCFDQRLFFFAKAKSLVPATTANKAAAERWIHGLPAGERTDVMQSVTTGLAMLREALRRDPKGRAEIFILTDGRETVKTTSVTRVEAAYRRLPTERCRIHVVALGRKSSPRTPWSAATRSNTSPRRATSSAW